MKLLRYGPVGAEKPGILDSRGHLRDLSAHVDDIAGVVLTPDTPWVQSRMMILYKSTESAALPADEVRRRTPPERSQDYSAFVKRAKCGPAGDFSFQGLPRGTWYVITVVRPVGGTGGTMALMKRVTVRGGRAVPVTR